MGLIAFGLWGWCYAHADLWWDEIRSLTDFSLVDFTTTVTTYPGPNNHILFNLLNNGWTRLLGLRDAYAAAEHVAQLRVLQWAIALAGLVYLFLTAKRFFGPTTGALAVVLQISCLPFLNFTMQLRGYNLSIVLVTAALYHGWTLLEGRSIRHAATLFLLCFALLYTVPSNAYFLMALGAVTCAELAIRMIRVRRDRAARMIYTWPPWRRPEVWLLLALGLGALAAFLAYTPVLDGLLTNRFVVARPPSRFFVLSERLPKVLASLLCYRYALLLLVLPGFYRAFRDRDGDLPGSRKAAALLTLLCLPFVLSFLRNGKPFERTFIHLTPVFALILAAGCGWALQGLRSAALRRGLVPVLGVYALATGGLAHAHVQDRLQRSLRMDVLEQSILANYYLARDYRPRAVARFVAGLHEGAPGPVVLVGTLDRIGWSFYLDEHDLTCYVLVRVEIQRQGRDPSRPTYLATFQKTTGKGRERERFRRALQPSPKAVDPGLAAPLQILSDDERATRIYLVASSPDRVHSLLSELYPEYRVARAGDPDGPGSILILDRVTAR